MGITIYDKDNELKKIDLIMQHEIVRIRQQLINEAMVKFKEELTKLALRIGLKIESYDDDYERKKYINIILEQGGRNAQTTNSVEQRWLLRSQQGEDHAN